MAYDRADWHYGGDYPDELPQENGGTHIGMFLAWAINNNLEGALHKEESQQSLNAVRNKEMTGREFLEKECDGKFLEDDLNEEGNSFAKHYYQSIFTFLIMSLLLQGVCLRDITSKIVGQITEK